MPIIFCILIYILWLLIIYTGLLEKIASLTVKALNFSESASPFHDNNRKISKKKHGQNFIAIFYTTFWNFYPRILIECFKLINCVKIDETEISYLSANPDIVCWQSEHLHLILSLFLPSLILWGILPPLFIGGILYCGRKKKKFIRDKNLQGLYSFLQGTYRRQSSHLDIFFFLAKLAMASFPFLFKMLSSISQVAIVICVLLLLLYLQEASRMFKLPVWNNVRSCSLMNLMFLFGFAYLSSVEVGIKENLLKGYFVCLIAVQAGFVIYVLILSIKVLFF